MDLYEALNQTKGHDIWALLPSQRFRTFKWLSKSRLYPSSVELGDLLRKQWFKEKN
jgi:hypothetical protein